MFVRVLKRERRLRERQNNNMRTEQMTSEKLQCIKSRHSYGHSVSPLHIVKLRRGISIMSTSINTSHCDCSLSLSLSLSLCAVRSQLISMCSNLDQVFPSIWLSICPAKLISRPTDLILQWFNVHIWQSNQSPRRQKKTEIISKYLFEKFLCQSQLVSGVFQHL